MWDKLITSGAIFPSPSLDLSLERVSAVKAVVLTTGKRVPLVNRQLVHIRFLFHFTGLRKNTATL